MFNLKNYIVQTKIEDVSKLYNIVNITDEYIVTKKEKLYRIYIYEIEPVVLINIEENIKQQIIVKYIEFLRQMNYDFQILSRNYKLNIDKYLKSMDKYKDLNDYNFLEKYKQYQEGIRETLKKENMYVSKKYIILNIDDNLNNVNEEILNVDNIMLKLNDIGCNVKKIKEIKNLKNILYECINKKFI